MKLSISEAAKHLGITKEAVYNRIRRNTLKSITQNGVKVVIIEEDEPEMKLPSDENLSSFLHSRIDELKSENLDLKKHINDLHSQKEQLLIENKNEIKSIYSERDDKIRYFLNMIYESITKKDTPYLAPIDIELVEEEKKWVLLSEFLSSMPNKKRSKFSKKILKKIGKSKNIKLKNGAIWLRASKFKNKENL